MLPTRLKVEEIPVVSGFVYDLMSLHYSDFTDVARLHYTPAYKTTFNGLIIEVNNLTGFPVLRAQLKKITTDLELKMTSVRPVLKKFEIHLKLAHKNLTIPVKDFGLKLIRDEISNGNAEGILNGFGILLTNIDDNHAALEAKGLTTELLSALTGLRDDIRTLNNSQSLKQTEISEVAKANWKKIEELWDITKEVMETGKGLYYFDNRERAKGFTLSVLKSRVNHEDSAPEDEPVTEKGILDFKVTEKATGTDLVGAEYEIVETADTDLTDEEGEGGLDLPVGSYTLKVRMEGYIEQTIPFQIKKDETTELNIQMVALPPQA
jgi:hypothetical protein